MRCERTRIGRSIRTPLALILSTLLVLAATLSVNHSLHSALHDKGQAGHSFCLVCAFAKGQLSAAAVELAAAILIICLWLACRHSSTSFLPLFDYRLSPTRAPPGIS